MDVSIGSVSSINNYAKDIFKTNNTDKENRNATFEAIFQSAVDMVKETNAYSESAEQEEMAYAMGLTNSTHDLQIAQAKASISLQYTVAVRNAALDAYKEIMQLQF